MSSKIITTILLLFIALVSCKTNEAFLKFGVDFSKVSKEAATDFDLLIIETANYTSNEIENLNQPGNTILGYVSLSEVNPSRWYFPILEKRGFLGENSNWGSFYINLEDSVSRSFILDQVIPEILMKGVDGLFLDTIDGVAPYTERNHLESYMVELIGEIRAQHPDIQIIQNSGLFLLEQTRNWIDKVLIESVATNYDFTEKRYLLRDDEEYIGRVQWFRNSINTFDGELLLLEYVDRLDVAQTVTNRLDTLGYPYYLARIELDSLLYHFEVNK